MMTVDGFPFDAGANVWRLASRQGAINVDHGQPAAASAKLRAVKKEIMARLVGCCELHEVLALHHAFSALVEAAASRRPGKLVRKLAAADLRTVVAGTPPGKEHRIVRARGLVRVWDGSGLPGLEPDLAALARDISVSVPQAGRAVAMLCPREGSLSEGEMANVIASLHERFAAGSITLASYLLCLNATTLVLRPLQSVLLKVGDLRLGGPGDDTPFVLSVPRTKQGGRVREQMRDVGLQSAFGSLMWRQREAAILMARERLHPEICSPMFPGVVRSAAEGGPSARLPELAGHMSVPAVSQRISNTLNRLGICSDRTGEPLNITSVRLRRTAATLGYASGMSLAEISAMLDHTDPGACLAYVERTQELFARVAAAAGGGRHAEMAREMLRGRGKGRSPDQVDPDASKETAP